MILKYKYSIIFKRTIIEKLWGMNGEIKRTEHEVILIFECLN